MSSPVRSICVSQLFFSVFVSRGANATRNTLPSAAAQESSRKHAARGAIIAVRQLQYSHLIAMLCC